MDIKVGDKVRYTGPSEYDVTHGMIYPVICVNNCPVIDILDDLGDVWAIGRSSYEPATDTPQAVPDYNNGEWHGWNGGERPVHGKSVVECEIGWREKRKAEEFVWDYRGPNEIIAFRVTKPYVEPKKPHEVFIDTSVKENWRFTHKHNPNAVLFREVLDD